MWLIRRNRNGTVGNSLFDVPECCPGVSVIYWTLALLLGSPLLLLHELHGLTLRRGRLQASSLRENLGRAPLLLYTWHGNWSLFIFAMRKFPLLRKVSCVGHNHFISLLFGVPLSYFGYRVYCFFLNGILTPTEQLAEPLLNNRALAIAPDSGGPYLKLKPGIIRLTQLTGAQLLPVVAHSDSDVMLSHRMHHRFPRLGSKIHCLIGKPVDLLEGTDQESLRLNIERCEQALHLLALSSINAST